MFSCSLFHVWFLANGLWFPWIHPLPLVHLFGDRFASPGSFPPGSLHMSASAHICRRCHPRHPQQAQHPQQPQHSQQATAHTTREPQHPADTDTTATDTSNPQPLTHPKTHPRHTSHPVITTYPPPGTGNPKPFAAHPPQKTGYVAGGFMRATARLLSQRCDVRCKRDEFNGCYGPCVLGPGVSVQHRLRLTTRWEAG